MKKKITKRWATFNISAKDRKLVDVIVARALCNDKKLDSKSLEMDLIATHSNGCPMDFSKLLNAPIFDFAHDIYGIQSHINRDTGELEYCILPRCFTHEKL